MVLNIRNVFKRTHGRDFVTSRQTSQNNETIHSYDLFMYYGKGFSQEALCVDGKLTYMVSVRCKDLCGS